MGIGEDGSGIAAAVLVGENRSSLLLVGEVVMDRALFLPKDRMLPTRLLPRLFFLAWPLETSSSSSSSGVGEPMMLSGPIGVDVRISLPVMSARAGLLWR